MVKQLLNVAIFIKRKSSGFYGNTKDHNKDTLKGNEKKIILKSIHFSSI